MQKKLIQKFMLQAIEEGKKGVEKGSGGPFGAIVVKDMNVVGIGCNEVTSLYDPTAHAEIMAIRHACQTLKTYSLKGCVLFTSCEPCPMCLGAIYWARLDTYYYAATRDDAQQAGFDDSLFYKELDTPPHGRSVRSFQVEREKSLELFKLWHSLTSKKMY